MAVFVQPPNGGFYTPSRTRLTVVFGTVHHHTPAQRWFSYTTVHLLNGSFFTPSCTARW
jgi:hypothetical protein